MPELSLAPILRHQSRPARLAHLILPARQPVSLSRFARLFPSPGLVVI